MCIRFALAFSKNVLHVPAPRLLLRFVIRMHDRCNHAAPLSLLQFINNLGQQHHLIVLQSFYYYPASLFPLRAGRLLLTHPYLLTHSILKDHGCKSAKPAAETLFIHHCICSFISNNGHVLTIVQYQKLPERWTTRVRYALNWHKFVNITDVLPENHPERVCKPSSIVSRAIPDNDQVLWPMCHKTSLPKSPA